MAARARSRPARRRPRRDRRGAGPRPCPTAPPSTSRAICASAVSAPDPRRAHDEAPARVDGRAGDLVAGCRSTGRTRRSAATGRPPRSPPRRRRRSRSSRPGRTTKRSPTASWAIGTRCSAPFASSTATSFAPSSSRARSAAPGTPPRARLEVAAGEDERRHDGRDLEVDPVARRRRESTRSNGMRMPGRPAPRKQSATTDQPHAESVPS